MAIKTLSIPKDMDEFLGENPDLSPSKMLQSKIIEIRENRRMDKGELMRQKRLTNLYMKKLFEANETIDKLKNKNDKSVQPKHKDGGVFRTQEEFRESADWIWKFEFEFWFNSKKIESQIQNFKER